MAATAYARLREHWSELKAGQPGHRFQDRFERTRDEEKKHGAWHRLAFSTAGVACLAIGAVLSVIPGPAIPFFVLGGWLLASESRLVAGFLDWSEVRGRKILTWAGKHWRRLPTAVRILLIILAVGCVATVGYLGFRLVRD